MLVFSLIGLFSCGNVVLGLTLPGSDPSMSKPGLFLPQFDPNSSQRAQEVAITRAGYLYGPPLIGNSSFFPKGTLGTQRVEADELAFAQNAAFITEAIYNESGPVIQKITEVWRN